MVGFYVIILQQHNAANAPDLRDRFIVGTGSSYNLNATGGSANAVLIAHNHDVYANGSNTDQNDYFGGSTANYGINANGIGNITYTTIKTKVKLILVPIQPHKQEPTQTSHHTMLLPSL